MQQLIPMGHSLNCPFTPFQQLDVLALQTSLHAPVCPLMLVHQADELVTLPLTLGLSLPSPPTAVHGLMLKKSLIS